MNRYFFALTIIIIFVFPVKLPAKEKSQRQKKVKQITLQSFYIKGEIENAKEIRLVTREVSKKKNKINASDINIDKDFKNIIKLLKKEE